MIRKEFKKTWWVSNLLAAPIFPIYMSIIFSFFSATGTGSMSTFNSFLAGVIYLSLFSLVPLFIAVALGYTDVDMYEKEKRTFFYIIAIIGYILAFVEFSKANNHDMAALSLSYLAVSIVIVLVNLKWKISAHTAGTAGPLTAIVYVFGFSWIWLYMIVFLVIYIRYKLEAHDISQLIAGSLVGILVTLVTYMGYTKLVLW